MYEQNYPSKFAMQPFAKQPHENQLFGVISKRYHQDELSKDFHVISSRSLNWYARDFFFLTEVSLFYSHRTAACTLCVYFIFKVIT